MMYPETTPDANLARVTAVTLARVAFTVELLARVVADLAQ